MHRLFFTGKTKSNCVCCLISAGSSVAGTAIMYHSGRFPYAYDGPMYGHRSGYAEQYAAPYAKRFCHEKWNGMGRNCYFPCTSQNPYSGPRPNSGFYNPHQFGVPYNGSENLGQQSIRRGFEFGQQFMSFAADQSMKSHVPNFRAVRPGYSHTSKHSKHGNRGGSKFANQSDSSLKADILDKFAAHGRDGYEAHELAGILLCPKKDVNRVLYSMEREGLVDKTLEQPPRWMVRTQQNVSAANNSGFNSLSVGFTSQKGSELGNSLNHSVSSRSVVPLGGRAMNDEPAFSGTSESFDVIPAVAIRDAKVPAVVNDHTFALASCGLDPPKTAANAENTRLCSGQNVGQVYRQDVSHPSASLAGSGVTASFVNTSDVSRQKQSLGKSWVQTIGESRKPAGRGRGVLLLRDAPAGTVGNSSLPASSQSKCHETQLDAEQFLDNGQFDSELKPNSYKPLLITGVNNPAGIVDIHGANKAMISEPTVKLEPNLQDRQCVAGSEVSSGLGVGQSVGTFKPPLPPKQLIRASPTYKAAMQHEVKLQSIDDANLSYGMRPGSSFAQNREASFAESESYKSLPESLSAMSFHPPSLPLPGTRSLGDLRNSCVPVDNPFAMALGMEDTSDVDDVSSDQMPEGAAGLSLTGESFAALNKNSVSALMEYAQSRHVNVEVKCIGSFGPPHRPMYVSLSV